MNFASSLQRNLMSLFSILLLQFMFDIAVYLDTRLVGQVLGFFYLTFVPGIIFLKILKLEHLSFAEVVSLSVGLSVAFLMYFGLLLNEILPLFGFLRPLSNELLIISLNSLITVLCIIMFFKEKNVKSTFPRLSFLELSTIIFLTCLPLTSVAGANLMNVNKDNSLLLLMMIFIPISIIIVLFLRKKFTIDIFPIALLTIYIAVLSATWLSTNYIFGYDAHSEFYAFQLTKNASHWNPVKNFEIERDKALDTLSMTILPTIYSNVMNLDPTWVIKIVYPLLASLALLGLYRLFLIYAEKEAAFLGAFLFITASLGGLGSLKEWIATIFYVLLFYVILSDKISTLNKKLLFILFSGGLIVSHYAKSYIFMFILLLVWIIMFVLKKNSKVTLSMVLTFLCMIFAWNIFTLQATTFEELVRTFDHIYRTFITDFFNPESRGQEVMMATGLLAPPTYLHIISRLIFNSTILLIGVGFISLTMKFRKSRSNHEYFFLVFLNIVLLAMAIIVPNLAESLKMGRIYRTTLVFLAPLCFLGVEEITANIYRLFRKTYLHKKHIALMLTLLVLIFNFLFQTETIYEIAKVQSCSLPLSRNRMNPITLSEILLYETDVTGAVWLFKKCGNSTAIYADYISKFNVLTSYGLIYYKKLYTLTNTTTIDNGDFIYLSQLNILYGTMIGYLISWNTTDLQSLLNAQNIIYTNGECNIYKNPDV